MSGERKGRRRRTNRGIAAFLAPITQRARDLGTVADEFAERNRREALQRHQRTSLEHPAERLDGLLFARKSLQKDIPALAEIAKKAGLLAYLIGVEDAFWIKDDEPRREAERLAYELGQLLNLYWAEGREAA